MFPNRTFSSLIMLCILLSGCAVVPALDPDTVKASRMQGYPDLVPTEGLIGRIPPEAGPTESRAALDRRVAGLRARASRLRGEVIDSDAQARLRDGVNR